MIRQTADSPLGFTFGGFNDGRFIWLWRRGAFLDVETYLTENAELLLLIGDGAGLQVA